MGKKEMERSGLMDAMRRLARELRPYADGYASVMSSPSAVVPPVAVKEWPTLRDTLNGAGGYAAIVSQFIPEPTGWRDPARLKTLHNFCSRVLEGGLRGMGSQLGPQRVLRQAEPDWGYACRRLIHWHDEYSTPELLAQTVAFYAWTSFQHGLTTLVSDPGSHNAFIVSVMGGSGRLGADHRTLYFGAQSIKISASEHRSLFPTPVSWAMPGSAGTIFGKWYYYMTEQLLKPKDHPTCLALRLLHWIMYHERSCRVWHDLWSDQMLAAQAHTPKPLLKPLRYDFKTLDEARAYLIPDLVEEYQFETSIGRPYSHLTLKEEEEMMAGLMLDLYDEWGLK